MANTITALYTVDASLGGAGPVRYIKVEHDGLSGDAIIFSPQTDHHVFLVGFLLSDGDPALVTFKSGSDTLITLDMAANSGIWDKIGNGFAIASEKGEDLIINSDAAATFLCAIIEERGLVFA